MNEDILKEIYISTDIQRKEGFIRRYCVCSDSDRRACCQQMTKPDVTAVTCSCFLCLAASSPEELGVTGRVQKTQRCSHFGVFVANTLVSSCVGCVPRGPKPSPPLTHLMLSLWVLVYGNRLGCHRVHCRCCKHWGIIESRDRWPTYTIHILYN